MSRICAVCRPCSRTPAHRPGPGPSGRLRPRPAVDGLPAVGVSAQALHPGGNRAGRHQRNLRPCCLSRAIWRAHSLIASFVSARCHCWSPGRCPPSLRCVGRLGILGPIVLYGVDDSSLSASVSWACAAAAFACANGLGFGGDACAARVEVVPGWQRSGSCSPAPEAEMAKCRSTAARGP